MTRRASDFWITDRRFELERLGSIPANFHKQLLDELEASRARERELEAKLAEPGTIWSAQTAQAIAVAASEQLPPGKQYWGGLGPAVDRAIHAAMIQQGLLGDHAGLRVAAKVRLIHMREDFRVVSEFQREIT